MIDTIENRIIAMIAPSVEAMGFDLVRVRLSGGDGDRTLQIMAEPADGSEMLVDHCAEISETVSALLDVEDPIPGAYALEVSSPGIDRPLTRARDFERFAGHEAKVELDRAGEGQRRYRGVLAGVADDEVALECEPPLGLVRLPLARIAEARLVLTDELIRESLKRRKNDGE